MFYPQNQAASESLDPYPHISAAFSESKADSHWLDRTAPPREEARILFEMLGRNGETVESIRELIAVPSEIEGAL